MLIKNQISDYWIIRSRKLHVSMLYQNDGIYRYSHGVNWRALVTLLVVFPVNLPGLIHAIDARIDIGNYTYFCEIYLYHEYHQFRRFG